MENTTNIDEQLKNAEKEFNCKKAELLVEEAKKPENAVRFELTKTVSDKLQNDETVKERVNKTADKVVDTGLKTVESEVNASGYRAENDEIQAYFDQHKEELKTAGIDKPTYMEDMERGVKAHRKWSNIHWKLFGWWQTGIRTFFMKAKPFKLWLNVMAIILCTALTFGVVYGIIALINIL